MEEQQGYEERAVAVMERPDAMEPAGPEARPPSIIRPVASSEEVLAAWQQFQELKRNLLTLDDYQDVQGRPRIKKSGWRKIAAAFGISDQILREERRDYEPPAAATRYFVWEITVRAVAPNGRYADAVGSCASNERRFAHLDHDTRAVAHTRAKNRAVADLVGGGEVSAEEIDVTVVEQAALPPAVNGRVVDAPRPAEAAAPEPAAFNGEAATDAQLRAIRAHLHRTGIDEARACARAGVDSLDGLTRRAAAQLLGQLSKQPNAA